MSTKPGTENLETPSTPTGVSSAGEKSPIAHVSIANDNEIYCCWKTTRRKKIKTTKNSENGPNNKKVEANQNCGK